MGWFSDGIIVQLEGEGKGFVEWIESKKGDKGTMRA
jgi:hypothetical protein